MADSSEHPDVPDISYEELANIEEEFDDVDTEIMRKQYEMSQSLYAKRATAISKIPNFWPLVLEQAPLDIDQFIQPSDSRIFVESLTDIHVSRPELDANLLQGSPKGLKIRFEFKANDDFEDTVLEKEFHYRRAKDGWAGLVSEPVQVHWKKGKDLSEGLNEGAVKLFEARKKAGDYLNKEVPEYAALEEKVEHLNGAGTSFFTWFGWVSSRRYVTAEESEKAFEEHRAKREKRKAGEKVDDAPAAAEDADDRENDDDADVEVHEMGEELAVSLAEDLWPGAIKYFLQAQEAEDMSEVDFEDDEMDEDDDDDGEPIDIRELVNATGKKRARASDVGAPSKKKA